ncbi:uracil-DNA glycosylase [Mycolicibacterium hippocampi]|uniref:uracil-DNA glycosylase n=1 Tax=Mycolicibacterium hippocampi TaxID=659824 RepID=UPI0013D1BEBA|nr:uracil-DNA glycosylase family protein [Mycolicibacterium hippocampi]
MTTLEGDDDSRRQRKNLLDNEIRACRRCDGMNKAGVTQAAPGWGDLHSPVMIIGQSLCKQCMKPQEPFFEGSGSLLNQILRLAGRAKDETFISNVVHCHPPKNRRSHDHEIVNCSSYLHRELELVRPRLVIGLGKDAQRVLSFFYPSARVSPWPFGVPTGRRPRGPYLLCAKHPSWIKRQHNDALEQEYVSSLAHALRWGFQSATHLPEPTCAGMADINGEASRA